MIARVIDEFQVLERYRVMVLDKDVCSKPHACYLINGQAYDPIRLHSQATTNTIPHNYIAVKSRRSFKGSTVELM